MDGIVSHVGLAAEAIEYDMIAFAGNEMAGIALIYVCDRDRAVSRLIDEGVAAGAPGHRVVAAARSAAGIERVVAGAAGERVGKACGAEGVVAGAASEIVGEG